jgi:hypothetical protein
MANGTAVSTPAQSTVNSHGRANTQPLVGPVGPAGFVYGDGTAVDATNQTEVQTYRRYLAEKQTPPQSKGALLAYYREVVAQGVARENGRLGEQAVATYNVCPAC